MEYVELVALLAILQFFFFGAMTGRARRDSGLKAPAISGDAGFERMYHVQMNTLEILVMFLPAIYIAGKYWNPLLISIIGSLYLIGRFLYWRAYVSSPSARGTGFILSIIPTALLILFGLGGIVRSLATG